MASCLAADASCETTWAIEQRGRRATNEVTRRKFVPASTHPSTDAPTKRAPPPRRGASRTFPRTPTRRMVNARRAWSCGEAQGNGKACSATSAASKVRRAPPPSSAPPRSSGTRPPGASSSILSQSCFRTRGLRGRGGLRTCWSGCASCFCESCAHQPLLVDSFCSIVDTRRPNSKRWWRARPLDGTSFRSGLHQRAPLSLILDREGDYEREAVVGVLAVHHREGREFTSSPPPGPGGRCRCAVLVRVGRRPTPRMTGRR